MTPSESLGATIPDEDQYRVKLENWKMVRDRINQFDNRLLQSGQQESPSFCWLSEYDSK